MQDKITEFNFDKQLTSRILGILWNSSTDCFQFAVVPQTTTNNITKRTLLSEISKFFYLSSGLIGPVVIIPKLLM